MTNAMFSSSFKEDMCLTFKTRVADVFFARPGSGRLLTLWCPYIVSADLRRKNQNLANERRQVDANFLTQSLDNQRSILDKTLKILSVACSL